MSVDHEQGVTTQDLRVALSSKNTAAAQHGSQVQPLRGGNRGSRPEPAVPADILARARTAIHQANDVTPETDEQAEPALPIALSAVDDTVDRPDVAASVVPEPSEEPVEESEPPTPGRRAPAPWETSPEAGAPSTGTIDPPVPWRGYNPDYVADQMVPMMHARATTGWRSW
ncbi:MAG TPA: hypothetical protein VFP34_10805, partial [Microlunatus sp.]|nr:hypothetical protein [Microlunatus sp.]